MGIKLGNRVSVEYVGQREDGSVFDTSREDVAAESGLVEDNADRDYEPLTVTLGDGQIIEGLKDGILGLEVGDVETIRIPPEKGYGERNDDRIMEYDRDVFEKALTDEDLEEGMYVQSKKGSLGEVVRVTPTTVRVDFNHQLAGQTIEFDIEIIDVEE